MVLAVDDPSAPSDNLPEGLSDVYEGCKKVAADIAKCQPELIVILTPHGIPVNVMGKSGKPGVYTTDSAIGAVEWAEGHTMAELAVRLDPIAGEELIRHFSTSGIPCVRVTGTEAPLSASEIVPLWFLRSLASTSRPPKYLIVSLPTPFGGTSMVRSVDAKERVEQNLLLGDRLAGFLYWLPQRSVVVASANLAHSHATTCRDPAFLPDPKWQLPVSDSAAVFDAILEKWATTLNPTFLTLDAASLVSRAISCGFDALVTLHGLMKYEGLNKFSTRVEVRHRPSYVGMMAVSFLVEKRIEELSLPPKGVADQVSSLLSRLSLGSRPASLDMARPVR
ncbi:hypothetical protein HK104_006701 [Borealophlyctis nickersoniae]|nr:hypothetical protein HK104_006701 [Borealophlyctis nickersoniae]